MIAASVRASVVAMVAGLLVLATLTACHDDIPVHADFTGSVATDESDTNSEQEGLRVSRERRPQEFLSYGITEQDGFPNSIHVRYSVNRTGPSWEGVALHLTCGQGRVLSISNLPWAGERHATLLISLDALPPQAEDVRLHRYDSYSPDGHTEAASTQLDDAVWYQRLRSAETLTIELPDSDLDPTTFDLTRLFGTPLQGEIDNCAESEATSSAGFQRGSVAPSR